MTGAELERPGVVEPNLYDQLLALRDLIAPKATPDELALFASVSRHLDLDPFAGQICLIGRWDRNAGRLVHRHQITVAGRRAIADRTGRLRGIEGPVWCGPRDDAGELNWREVWDDDDPLPYCARVLVYRADWDVAANGTAKFSEFAQTDKDGRLTPTWAAMPSHMLGKVAESLALRRAFPEVERAIAVAGGGWPDDAWAGDADADDAAVLEEAAAPENPAPEIPAPGGTGTLRPSTAGAGQPPAAAAPGFRQPVERRRRRDEVPVELYDNLPEAQG